MSDPVHRLGALRAGLGLGSVVSRLRNLAETFPGKVVFSTSFGLEDQAITHLIFDNELPIRVFTLDTGRLFSETYSTWARTFERYKQPIEAFSPDAADSSHSSPKRPQQLLRLRRPPQNLLPYPKSGSAGQCPQGPVGMGHRHPCRTIAQPPRHAGPRMGPRPPKLLQIPTRSSTGPGNSTRDFIRQHHIPYNALHDKGFVSIGCAPCTRAIQPGEDFRAGRWWWEDASKKECEAVFPPSCIL